MKKKLFMVLVASVLALIPMGCGKDGDEDSQNAASKPTSEEENPRVSNGLRVKRLYASRSNEQFVQIGEKYFTTNGYQIATSDGWVVTMNIEKTLLYEFIYDENHMTGVKSFGSEYYDRHRDYEASIVWENDKCTRIQFMNKEEEYEFTYLGDKVSINGADWFTYQDGKIIEINLGYDNDTTTFRWTGNNITRLDHHSYFYTDFMIDEKHEYAIASYSSNISNPCAFLYPITLSETFPFAAVRRIMFEMYNFSQNIPSTIEMGYYLKTRYLPNEYSGIPERVDESSGSNIIKTKDIVVKDGKTMQYTISCETEKERDGLTLYFEY